MNAKTLRLLMLAGVCAVSLWHPKAAEAWPFCPSTHCSFWRDVCETNGGTFTQTENGRCEQADTNIILLWNGHCEYNWRGPWDVDCYGI